MISTTTEALRVLGASSNEDLKSIKKKYLKLCKDKHPDNGGTQEEFIEIKSAWDFLNSNTIDLSSHRVVHTSVFDVKVS